MLRKFSKNSNYLDNYSIYQKNRNKFFILGNRCEIDLIILKRNKMYYVQFHGGEKIK